ncbi:hypothetical protein MBLNU459_g0123t1 [Dothideomycetes sp. NU459]
MATTSSRQRPSMEAATPHRGPQSTAAPTPRPTGEVGARLPGYQTLMHPLTADARQKMARLVNDRRLDGLDNNIRDMIECLGENAYQINDTLRTGNDQLRKERARKRAREEQDEADTAQDERLHRMETSVQEMRTEIEKITQRIDDNTRKMIDGQNSINNVRSSLKEVAEEASVTAGTQPTQRGQVRSQRRRRNNPDADEDEEYDDFDPTDPTNAESQSTQRHTSSSASFKAKVERKKERYQALTLSARYSSNNDYRALKSFVHDALHGEDGVPLAHERTWFNDGVVPAPGVTTRSNDAAGDESDDDIQIAKEKISTKCPLTLQEFADPVTSRKCPHSFEKEAIMGMINSPTNVVRVGGSGARGSRDGQKAVQCPVPGCANMITASDLHADPVLMRKIQRIQRANRAAEEDSGDDETHPGRKGRAQTILSEDDDLDVDAEQSTGRSFKVEPRSTARSTTGRRTASRAVEDEEVDEDEDDVTD